MAAYSPFAKDLSELQTSDLAALTQAAEGWYIEYKQEVPNASSMAKSLSAMANTYGGWVFYGVKEKSKEDAVAGSFPGISRSEVDASLQRLRQAAAVQVEPSPHFDTKILWGPCTTINLLADHAIICVYVPWSPNTPHIHNDARIYRRVADGSEPKPANDRFTIDQLYERANRIRQSYKEWVERRPELSKGEDERPYLRVILVPDLWGDHGLWTTMNVTIFREIMNASDTVAGSLPFDTIYTSARGFVARQNLGNDPHNLNLTWRMGRDFTSDILIPLNYYFINDPSMLIDYLHGYKGAEHFAQIMSNRGFSTSRVIDFNYIFNAFIGVVEAQKRLLKHVGWTGEYFCKVQMFNVWRTVPFLDIASIISEFEKHGVPTCLDSMVTAHPGTDPETFAEMPTFKEINTTEYGHMIARAMYLFALVAQAFGIPIPLTSGGETGELPYFDELQQAGHRAMEIQKMRNASREV